MAYKQYMCRQIPGLKIGDHIQFVRGFYGTDNEDIQRTIEKNDWYGCMIVLLPDALHDLLGSKPQNTAEQRKSTISDDFVNELARRGPRVTLGAVGTGNLETRGVAEPEDDGIDVTVAEVSATAEEPVQKEAKQAVPTATEVTRMRVGELRECAQKFGVPIADEFGELYSGAKLLGMVRRQIGV